MVTVLLGNTVVTVLFGDTQEAQTDKTQKAKMIIMLVSFIRWMCCATTPNLKSDDHRVSICQIIASSRACQA